MAKVIAPFILSGTIDGINFANTTEGNIARIKSEKYMTSKEFYANPIYDRIREQGKEMGYCVSKSRFFRQLAVQFYKNSKEMSFGGRVNKILLEIVEEDAVNPKGLRTLDEGMKSPFLNEILIGFEGNKQRPLSKVLQTSFLHNPEERTIQLADFIALEHLDWPEGATHVHIAMANANWDYVNNTFDTCYSPEIKLAKESETQTLTLSTENPHGNNLLLTYLYIAFAKQERRKYKLLHRRNNTVSIIACHNPKPKT